MHRVQGVVDILVIDSRTSAPLPTFLAGPFSVCILVSLPNLSIN